MALPSLNGASERQGVSVSALLSKAVALAVEQHPLLNAHYDAKTKSIVYKKV
jgi:pyruvate/2-oxoglutarate dehydrogenase complex dihydrolipoamide acyltransferase (E2) component